MSGALSAYQPLFDHAVLNVLFALSQFVVLRAGVFSIATAGLASIGAYAAAILAMRLGLPPAAGLLAGTLAGCAGGLVLALPLARLRGIYQAIATLAFVQIVISLALYAESLTGGALGLNSIPKAVGSWHLLAALVLVVWLLCVLSANSVGRAFDAVRQDETVAISLGVSVPRYHTLAFALSGAIAGLGGGLYAFNSYSLVPTQFGFSMLVAALAAVVLGGRRSVAGPVVGAVFLTLLPEFGRVFASQHDLVHGALLILVILYMPEGIVDTLRMRLAGRRAGRLPAPRRPSPAGGRGEVRPSPAGGKEVRP